MEHRTPRRSDWLLYGAYGYTGRLIVERAVARGLRPVLAGRAERKVRALAADTDLEWRAFELEDAEAVRAGIDGMRVVFNAAGPFSATWRPLTSACLRQGCSYLDITGEIDVLESMQEVDAQVRAAGVHFVPAVGFDVVPTDCAAVLAAARLPAPLHLDLAFHAAGRPSRGTMRTAIERLDRPGAVRRDGRIEPVGLGSIRATIPFSDRSRRAVAIPWGDVSTAMRSTGIPNIRVFATLPRGAAVMGRLLGMALRVPGLRRLVDRAARALPAGPGPRELGSGRSRVRAVVRDAAGRSAAVELTTPNAYALTASAGVAAVERVLGGDVRAGAGVHTPSRAFGADFVRELPGVEVVEE